MTLIIAIVLGSLFVSFLCSLCEASLYAVTPSRVEALRREGGSQGRKLGQLRDRIDLGIAGILTLNTITHTLGAAWAGALVRDEYGNAWLGVFSGLFTLAILLLTEIVPKSVGVAWASEIAPRIAWIVQGMIWLVWPLAELCTLIMQRITRRAPGQIPSEQEIMVMAELAAKDGTILKEESHWVRNVLRLDDVSVRELMTPRSAVQSLPADLTLEQVEKQVLSWVHNRVPLTENQDLDRVVGVVQRRVVFDQLAQDESTKKSLRDLMRPALFVPEELRVHRLLELLIEQRQHLAIVQNRQQKTTGVVTLEDAMEYLLGRPIVGEHDIHPEMERMARERSRFHALNTLKQDPPRTY